MTDLPARLREHALALSSRFVGADRATADLLCEAADQIDMEAATMMYVFAVIYAVRKALGTGGMKAMLSDLPAEVARVRAADRADEREKCAP